MKNLWLVLGFIFSFQTNTFAADINQSCDGKKEFYLFNVPDIDQDGRPDSAIYQQAGSQEEALAKLGRAVYDQNGGNNTNGDAVSCGTCKDGYEGCVMTVVTLSAVDQGNGVWAYRTNGSGSIQLAMTCSPCIGKKCTDKKMFQAFEPAGDDYLSRRPGEISSDASIDEDGNLNILLDTGSCE